MRARLGLASSVVIATLAALGACNGGSSPATPPANNDAGNVDAGPVVCSAGARSPCTCPSGDGFGTLTCLDGGTGFSACMGCAGDAGPPGSGTPDASPAGPVDAAPEAAPPSVSNVAVVHAAPGVPPVRFCMGTSSGSGSPSVAQLPALPDAHSLSRAVPAMGPYPAVASGTPGFFPGEVGAPLPGIGLSNVAVSLFAVLASSVAADVGNDDAGVGPDGGAEESCVTLVGPHGLGRGDSPPGRLALGTDFFALGTIPAGTFANGATLLVSLTGCLPGAVSTGAATCGAGYDGGSNAAVGVASLDTTTTPASGLGVQFAPRSSALQGTAFNDGGVSHAAASDGVIPVLVSGSSATPIAGDTAVFFGAGGLTPSTAATSSIDPTSATASFGVQLVPTGGGSPNTTGYPAGDLLALSLDTVSLLSGWSSWSNVTSSSFTPGATYTFILVGDPAAPSLYVPASDGGVAYNVAYDGRGLHFVAVPNAFGPRAN